MKNNEGRKPKKEVEAIFDAIFEEKIKSKDLISEIKPLLEDYFMGKFEVLDGKLIYKPLNGQIFIISAEETSPEKIF